MKCPHCRHDLTAVLCPHCKKRISLEQSKLLSAVMRELAKLDGVRADATHEQGKPVTASPADGKPVPARPADGYAWEYTSRDTDAMATYLSVVRRKIDTFPLPETPEGKATLLDVIHQLMTRLQEVEAAMP